VNLLESNNHGVLVALLFPLTKVKLLFNCKQKNTTSCSDAQKTLRTQAIVDALHKNTVVLLDIDLYPGEFDKVLLDNECTLAYSPTNTGPVSLLSRKKRVSGVVSCSGGPWSRWLTPTNLDVRLRQCQWFLSSQDMQAKGAPSNSDVN
jgi:hypothetical protein